MVKLIQDRIQDAVTSLVVRLLRNGGQLSFGGHPSVIPMVEAAATNFSCQDQSHRPILLYQSERFRNAPEPLGRRELERSDVARVLWVPADPWAALERFQLQDRHRLDERTVMELCQRFVQHDSKAPQDIAPALAVLRMVMFLHQAPQAILSMGGMEGISAEAGMFQDLRPGSPEMPTAFALRSTYGAARRMLQEEGQQIQFVDPPNVPEEMLEPTTDLNIIEQQLMSPIRYDGVMDDLVKALQARALEESADGPL